MNVAAKCRLEKEQHPELYCADKRCLWHLASGPCPKHTKHEHRCTMWGCASDRDGCSCEWGAAQIGGVWISSSPSIDEATTK